MDIHITHTHTATHKATLLEPATMADALLHDLDWHTDDHAQHVDTVLQQMQKLGERAGQKIDTAYWNTALLDETCPANDVEYDIVWMAWLAQRARLSPDCQRDTPHVAVLARRLETFNGKKKQRPIYLSQALTYVTCAGYMDQSFGDAPPSPTRRAVRDNCLVLATHADACDMPIVREVWMHLFARTARATPSEVFKALLAWVLREESEAGGLRAIRVLISLEETWKVLPLSDVRGMRVLYHKLLDRASHWDPGGNAKVLWLGHLHRVQARSSLVQQRAALQLEHVVEHVMQSIAGGENLYIVQIALAILYEACLWRQPDAKLAVVLYTPTHQETMEDAMAKLVDESDCYSTAQQACVRYFRYLKDVMSATCIPSEVNLGGCWRGSLGLARSSAAAPQPAQVQHMLGLARAWPRRRKPPHRSQHTFSACPVWLELGRVWLELGRVWLELGRVWLKTHPRNDFSAQMTGLCGLQYLDHYSTAKHPRALGLPRPAARHRRHAGALRDRDNAPKHPLRLPRALSRPLYARGARADAGAPGARPARLERRAAASGAQCALLPAHYIHTRTDACGAGEARVAARVGAAS